MTQLPPSFLAAYGQPQKAVLVLKKSCRSVVKQGVAAQKGHFLVKVYVIAVVAQHAGEVFSEDKRAARYPPLKWDRPHVETTWLAPLALNSPPELNLELLYRKVMPAPARSLRIGNIGCQNAVPGLGEAQYRLQSWQGVALK